MNEYQRLHPALTFHHDAERLQQIREGVIYLITFNYPDKKMYYVGQTINPKKYGKFSRFYSHMTQAHGDQPRQLVDQKIKEVGDDNISYEEIYYVKDKLINVQCQLNIHERYYIKQYGSFGKNGYNRTGGGQLNYLTDAPENGEYSDDYKKMLLESCVLGNNSAPINLYIDGKFVRGFQSCSEAAKYLQLSHSSIQKLVGGRKLASRPNYQLKYVDEETHRKRMKIQTTQKKIYQYDYDGNLMKVWDCVSDLLRKGYHAGHLYECIKRERFGYKGYIWRKYDDCVLPETIQHIDLTELEEMRYLEEYNVKQKKANRRIARDCYTKSPILYYNDGKFVRKFDFLYECIDYFRENRLLNIKGVHSRVYRKCKTFKIHPEIELRYENPDDYKRVDHMKHIATCVPVIYTDAEGNEHELESQGAAYRYLRSIGIIVSKDTVRQALQGRTKFRGHSEINIRYKNPK